MASYTNASGGKLILPDGAEIEAGGSAEVSDTKNVGVSQWIDEGLLVKVADAPKRGKAEKTDEETGKE
jgi:hypothetical protein